MARDLGPDVIIMDIELAGEINGVEAGLRIKQENSKVGIVVLSLHGDKEYLASLPLNHAEGWSYLMKQTVSDLDALTRAIEGAAAGLMVLDPALVIGLRPKPRTRLEALMVRQPRGPRAHGPGVQQLDRRGAPDAGRQIGRELYQRDLPAPGPSARTSPFTPA